MKGKLKVWDNWLYRWCWEIQCKSRLCITPHRNSNSGYKTRQSAYRAAMKAAKKLNIEVEEVK
jgi:hypothetical protein